MYRFHLADKISTSYKIIIKKKQPKETLNILIGNQEPESVLNYPYNVKHINWIYGSIISRQFQTEKKDVNNSVKIVEKRKLNMY